MDNNEKQIAKEILTKLYDKVTEAKNYEITNAEQLETFRIKYLGVQGMLKELFGDMKQLPADLRKEFGKMLGEFKTLNEKKYEHYKSII